MVFTDCCMTIICGFHVHHQEYFIFRRQLRVEKHTNNDEFKDKNKNTQKNLKLYCIHLSLSNIDFSCMTELCM